VTETTNPAETAILGTVPVTGTFFQATQPVSGPLTDAQLRATPVPISGTITATVAANQSVNIAQVSGVSASVTNPLFTKLSDGAAAQGVVANPLIVGGRAATTNPTAATDAGAVNAMLDKLGKMVVQPFAVRGLKSQNAVTLTTTTETTLLTAGGAGVFLDLTQVVMSNENNTDVRVDFRDATAGTVRFSIFLAKASVGQTAQQLSFSSPMEQSSANNNWTVQASASSSVRILGIAVKNL